jgi:rhomboid protease GluP
MAIGFPPRHTARYAFDSLAREHFLVLAVEAAGRLGWPLRRLSASGIVAEAPGKSQQIVVQLRKNSAHITVTSLGGKLSDEGKSKTASAQFLALIDELRQAIPEDELTAAHERLQAYLPPPGADDFLKQQSSARFSDVLHLFKPAGGYFITPILVNLNLLIFLLMVLTGVSATEPDSASLIRWGANLGTLSFAGEWWRLLTSIFLHIGLMHLAMNMVALMLIGAQLEPRIGRLRFLGAYLMSGIVASLCSILWHGHTISAGASGAIFGMYGAFLALVAARLVRDSNKKQIVAVVLFFVVYNLLNGLKPGIDNAAHAGGLLSGFLIGYAFVPRLKRLHKQVQPAMPEAEKTASDDPYY